MPWPCRCERRRGLRHGQTGTRPYPRRRTSPLTGNRRVPLFVCPAVRPFPLASRFCYSPLIFRFAPNVLDQYIFLFYPYILIGASRQSMPLQVILLQNKCGVACRCKPALAGIFLVASLQAYFCRPVCRKAIPPHSEGRKITCKGHRNMADSRGKYKICQI